MFRAVRGFKSRVANFSYQMYGDRIFFFPLWSALVFIVRMFLQTLSKPVFLFAQSKKEQVIFPQKPPFYNYQIDQIRQEAENCARLLVLNYVFDNSPGYFFLPSG